MSLVHVETPCERNGRPPGERTSHQHAWVASNRGQREAGDVAIVDATNVLESIGETRQPGSQYEADDGTLRPDSVADRGCDFHGRLRAVGTVNGDGHRSPRRSAAISSRALATMESRSAGGTNAL